MMRRLILIITLLALVLCPSALLGKGTHYSSRSHHSRSHTALHVRHHRSHSYATKYEPGQTYKTTGEPKVERSESAKEAFLRAHGYRRVPPGYEVDHIIPLSEGGSDTPDNMQLLTKAEHRAKTAAERRRDRSLHHGTRNKKHH